MEGPSGAAARPPAQPMRQLLLPMHEAAAPTLDSFVAGRNALAVAQLMELLQLHADGGRVPPIYLWGPRGAGKTHLLRALAASLQATGAPVACLGADTPLPWSADDRELIVLDDCDRYDAARQHAAFALFVDAGTRGALIAAAGRVPPVDLPLRDDLRTRFGWGHVIALQPLADAEAAAVLGDELARRGIRLPPEVLRHLQAHHPRDLSSLKTLLDALEQYAVAHKRALTVPALKEALRELDAAR